MFGLQKDKKPIENSHTPIAIRQLTLKRERKKRWKEMCM